MSLPADSWPPRCPLRRSEPLAGWTTLKVGGPAERFFEPARPADLADLLAELERRGIPWRLLGGGANTLAPDGGVPGAVLHTGFLRRVFREGDRLRVEAGATLPALVHGAARLGLAGLEPLVGVPGQLGGALAMNAGSAGWGIWDAVAEVGLWVPGTGRVVRTRAEIAPRYRDGNLGGAVVLEAVLELAPAPSETIRDRLAALLRRKNATQPVKLTSAGCAFRNPPGESAGRLLEAVGLKGVREGGAQVSPIHANFVVNTGTATARDVRGLLERMQAAVRKRFGISLEREIVVWPEPSAPLPLKDRAGPG